MLESIHAHRFVKVNEDVRYPTTVHWHKRHAAQIPYMCILTNKFDQF